MYEGISRKNLGRETHAVSILSIRRPLFSKPDIHRINFELSDLSNKVITLNYV